MKCIVNRIVELATARVKGPATPVQLNEVQTRVQDAFRQYDFGCHTEGVAKILEALTGHKPSKGPGSGFSLLDVGQLATKDLRFIVLGTDGGYTYGFSVDNPKGGHIAVTAENVKQISDEEKLAIIAKFSEINDTQLLTFMTASLGGKFPGTLFAALD